MQSEKTMSAIVCSTNFVWVTQLLMPIETVAAFVGRMDFVNALADIGSKNYIRVDRNFGNEAEVKSAIKTFFDSFPSSFFVSAFSNLVKRWEYVLILPRTIARIS